MRRARARQGGVLLGRLNRAGRQLLGDVDNRAASSAASRTISACWLARSVSSPVVPATSWVDAVICWVEAAISSAMAAASWAC